jgi:hypothetical protein
MPKVSLHVVCNELRISALPSSFRSVAGVLEALVNGFQSTAETYRTAVRPELSGYWKHDTLLSVDDVLCCDHFTVR